MVLVALLALAFAACDDGPGTKAAPPGTPSAAGTPPAAGSPAASASATTAANGAGKIAFISYRSGRSEVWVVGPDGKDLRKLTDTPAQKPNLYWSPDGSQIAFAAVNATTQKSEFFAIAADGSGQPAPATASTVQAWFEDRLKARGAKYQLDPQTARTVTDSTGTTVLSIANDQDASRGTPQWSPDGKKIVVALARGVATGLTEQQKQDLRNDPAKVTALTKGKFEIWVIDVANKTYTQLTRNTVDDDDPSWSPDGTQIAFSSDRDGDGQTELYVMNADGTGERRLTPPPEAGVSCSPLPACPGDTRPSWSPK